MTGITPHGGRLIDRFSKTDPSGMESVTIGEGTSNDVENIADGIFSPLEGFLNRADFESVINQGPACKRYRVDDSHRT